jgi:hypothetical protein
MIEKKEMKHESNHIKMIIDILRYDFCWDVVWILGEWNGKGVVHVQKPYGTIVWF